MHGTADIWINEHKTVNSQIPHNTLSLHKWSIPPNLELGQCRVFLPRGHMHPSTTWPCLPSRSVGLYI